MEYGRSAYIIPAFSLDLIGVLLLPVAALQKNEKACREVNESLKIHICYYGVPAARAPQHYPEGVSFLEASLEHWSGDVFENLKFHQSHPTAVYSLIVQGGCQPACSFLWANLPRV